MGKLLIVSNRLPVNVEKKRGDIAFQPSAGGLATGLASFYESYDSLWIGWPGLPMDRRTTYHTEVIEQRLRDEYGCQPVFLSRRDIRDYYEGFCNRTIWPLCHYFTQYVVYDESLYETYIKVNKLFRDVIVQNASDDDTIWIHDYHLLLLPQMVREELPDATIGFFLHIPFPSFEIFRLLPWREEIVNGMLGADLIGFHTYDYARHFLSTVRNLLGYEHSVGQIACGERCSKVDMFPMGIDYDAYAGAAETSEVQSVVRKLRARFPDSKVVASIDRLDYSKGIPQRLEAFDAFLRKNPEYRERVNLILVAVPSRTEVEHYKLLKSEVDELIGKINGQHGTIGWVPVWYLYRFLRYPTLHALYNLADVALVTPTRDGMNLIAKEYVASKTDGKGVLILSEMAGAAPELGEALIVNPNNRAEMVAALEKGLSMPEEEQIGAMTTMQKRLRSYNVTRWAEDFVQSLAQIKQTQRDLHANVLTAQHRAKLLRAYQEADRRLLLLDYDGTLMPLFPKPEDARPTEALVGALKDLTEDPTNDIVIISGRDKDTLEAWFGSLDVGMVAEHGAWVKERGGPWKVMEPVTSAWKDEIRPILELYMDRTPGSLIEEKEFSLVWHYRRAASQLATERARELTEVLLGLVAHLEIGVLEGSKVIEVKHETINKGRAALHVIAKTDWDFILAIGDDLTDEEIFTVLPEFAYSVKVGLGATRAKFNLASQREVARLLDGLISVGGKTT
jgi:trehalose 6-phosphate synthase/phosphatase